MASDVEQLQAQIADLDPLLRNFINLQKLAVSEAETDIPAALQQLDPPIALRERALAAVPILVALARTGIVATEDAQADLARFANLPDRPT